MANEVLLQMNLPNEMNNEAGEEETQENNLEENNTTEIFLEQGDTVYQVESRNGIEPGIIEEEEAEEEEVVGGGNFNTEVIQLLNTDGTIINIDKNLLISTNKHEVKKQEEQAVSIGQYIERITAYKCKRCGYLSETLIDITKHINSKVCEEVRPFSFLCYR